MSISLQRASGKANISFKQRDGQTVLDDLYQSGSAKIRMVLPEPGRLGEAVLINTSGGMTGGDSYEVELRWGKQTTAIVTTQAAERYYKSLGGNASIVTRIKIEEAACAFWLPQETIMFDEAAYERQTLVDMQANANFIGIESSVFGRTAMGETITKGRLREVWQIRIDGKLVFADAFSLEGEIDQHLSRKTIGNGSKAISTIIYRGPQMVATGDRINAKIEDMNAKGRATCLEQFVVVRLFAKNSQSLRILAMSILGDLLACATKSTHDHCLLPRVWSL